MLGQLLPNLDFLCSPFEQALQSIGSAQGSNEGALLRGRRLQLHGELAWGRRAAESLSWTFVVRFTEELGEARRHGGADLPRPVLVGLPRRALPRRGPG